MQGEAYQQDLEEDQQNNGLISQNSQLNKVSTWTIYLCPCIYLAMICIMSICLVSATGISQYALTKASINSLQNFYKNQAKYPLLDIKLVENTTTSSNSTSNSSNASNVSCPENYTQTSPYTFPGIESGCLCQDGSTHSSAYCLVVSSNGCQKVTSHKSSKFYDFDNSLICTLAYSSEQIQVLPTSGVCDANFTYCNSGYCVQTGLQCPINSLSSTSDNSTNTSDYVSLGIAKYYFTRNATGFPLVDVDATISNPSCLNTEAYPSTLSGEYYPYWKTALDGCDEFGDSSNWTLLVGSESQTNYFTENNIYTYLSELPYFSNYSNASDLYKLRGVKRMSSQRSAKCITLKSKLSDVTDSSEDTIEHMVDYSIANLILSLVGIVFCLGYYFGKNIKIFHRLVCQSPIVPYILLMICFTVMLLCFIMAGYYWNNENAIDEDSDALDSVNQAISEQCFDETGLAKALGYLKTYLELSDSWVFGAVVFLFAWSIIWAIVFAVCYVVRKIYVKDYVFARP